ncbi:MAG: lysophospholipid acyltransferase family protein, partial [Dehalococcoidia bacterium]
ADWQILEQASAGGKGVIIVPFHFGLWDRGGVLLSRRGHILHVLADHLRPKALDEAVIASRTGLGMRVIHLERSAVPIVRALRRNEILAILLDRPMPREAPTAVPVCFFGSRTYLPAGAARIALRTGAAVLPVALARVSGRDDRARVLIGSNLCCQRTGNEEEDVQTLTQAIVTAQEQFLRRFPDQWYMFRRMWPPPPEPRSQSQPRL